MKFKLPLFTIAIIYIILVAASPTAIYDDSNDNGLPLLKLPYGTWRAAKYDEGADVSSCKFALFLLSSFCFFYLSARLLMALPLILPTGASRYIHFATSVSQSHLLENCAGLGQFLLTQYMGFKTVHMVPIAYASLPPRNGRAHCLGI